MVWYKIDVLIKIIQSVFQITNEEKAEKTYTHLAYTTYWNMKYWFIFIFFIMHCKEISKWHDDNIMVLGNNNNKIKIEKIRTTAISSNGSSSRRQSRRRRRRMRSSGGSGSKSGISRQITIKINQQRRRRRGRRGLLVSQLKIQMPQVVYLKCQSHIYNMW